MRRAASVRIAALPLLQCALASGLAWFVATAVFGRAVPFFAPVAAIICLGVSLGARLRRTVEMVVGVSVGILVADLIVLVIGSGAWQIGLVVALSMGAAVLLDGGPIITVQAGSSAVLVATLLPPDQSGGVLRAADALIGGVVAVAVIAVLPADPLRSARRDASKVLDTLETVLRGVGAGLAERDASRVDAVLAQARGTQATLDSLRADLRAGREVARIAPLRWRSRARVQRLADMADPVDNAVRNTRVLARRALVVVGDAETIDPRLPGHCGALADAVATLRGYVEADPGTPPERADVVRELRAVAHGLSADLAADGGLSVRVVVAQLRSIVVDLLQAAGTERRGALASLPPTVAHPAVPPDDAV